MMFASEVDYIHLADLIRAGAKDRPGIFVAVDGLGGSGKSTFAGHLVAAIPGAFLVHVDDFYLPSAYRSERTGEVGSFFDLARLALEVTTPGAEGKAVRYQRYDWGRDELAEWVDIPHGAPIVLEGVYCLSAALRSAYTYKIWCRADAKLRLARGLARDGEEARSLWVELWMPAEDEYERSNNPEGIAELVVDSSLENEDLSHSHFVP